MNFIKRLFRSNMVDCPRCLGKGKVDLEDLLNTTENDSQWD